jgi:hypothetical protein
MHDLYPNLMPRRGLAVDLDDATSESGSLAEQAVDVPVVAPGDVADCRTSSFDPDGEFVVWVVEFGFQGQPFARPHPADELHAIVVLEARHGENVEQVTLFGGFGAGNRCRCFGPP